MSDSHPASPLACLLDLTYRSAEAENDAGVVAALKEKVSDSSEFCCCEKERKRKHQREESIAFFTRADFFNASIEIERTCRIELVCPCCALFQASLFLFLRSRAHSRYVRPCRTKICSKSLTETTRILSLKTINNSIKSDAAALDALSTLLLRRHLAAAVGASCAAVALRLAARLCSQQAPPLTGATAVDIAIALARLVEVVPHVAR